MKKKLLLALAVGTLLLLACGPCSFSFEWNPNTNTYAPPRIRPARRATMLGWIMEVFGASCTLGAIAVGLGHYGWFLRWESRKKNKGKIWADFRRTHGGYILPIGGWVILTIIISQIMSYIIPPP